MSRRRRRHVINLGGFRAIKIGFPSATADIYYATMAMSWTAFIAVVTAAFVIINLAFGVAYASLPGAIANAAPGSLIDGFFFSVETLGTVGHGNMFPASHLGHLIAATEILIGLFFSATITGLIFARFARPRMSFAFSRVVTLTRRENRQFLMVRLASVRLRPIADVSAQLSWLEMVSTADGRTNRRLVELPLLRAHNPQLAFSWTLVHEIAEPSPMLEALKGDGEFRLTATVSGTDTLLASQTLGGQTYGRDDVMIDFEFDDMIDDSTAVIQFDLTKLHDISPHVPT